MTQFYVLNSYLAMVSGDAMTPKQIAEDAITKGYCVREDVPDAWWSKSYKELVKESLVITDGTSHPWIKERHL
jgi:hypothetical protein